MSLTKNFTEKLNADLTVSAIPTGESDLPTISVSDFASSLQEQGLDVDELSIVETFRDDDYMRYIWTQRGIDEFQISAIVQCVQMEKGVAIDANDLIDDVIDWHVMDCYENGVGIDETLVIAKFLDEGFIQAVWTQQGLDAGFGVNDPVIEANIAA